MQASDIHSLASNSRFASWRVLLHQICTVRAIDRDSLTNHRLALAAAHASDSIPYLKQFKSTYILQTLFYFFQNSAVHMANLHEIQDMLNDPQIKCKQAKDVRWLSHDNAINLGESRQRSIREWRAHCSRTLQVHEMLQVCDYCLFTVRYSPLP